MYYKKVAKQWNCLSWFQIFSWTMSFSCNFRAQQNVTYKKRRLQGWVYLCYVCNAISTPIQLLWFLVLPSLYSSTIWMNTYFIYLNISNNYGKYFISFCRETLEILEAMSICAKSGKFKTYSGRMQLLVISILTVCSSKQFKVC